MSDMYNWNNDDFQNQPEETNEEKYFTYNETYLATRKQKTELLLPCLSGIMET